MNLALRVNGADVSLELDPVTPLLTVLRDHLALKGAKLGCGNGECGACTVLVDDRAVCACLYPVHRARAKAVTTVEGLATPGGLSPLQQAFIDHGATQCGFCTSGMLLAAEALLRDTPAPTEAQVVESLAGNLCRCTGYRQIIDAVLAASRPARAARAARPAIDRP